MSIDFKDYYETLGVSKTASPKEIKDAFRKLARKYHPDVAKDDKDAEARCTEITAAHEVLSDPEKRRKYDELGENWNRPEWQSANQGGFRAYPGGGGREFHFGGTGFSDFFEQFFGSGADAFGASGIFGNAQHGRGRSGTVSFPGRDIEADVLVTLDEVMTGSTRMLSLRRIDPQTGKENAQKIRIRIPVGVQEGKVIRLPGKGEDGYGGGPAGNLFLRVRFAQHPDFAVRGRNLHCEVELMPWVAVLGGAVTVRTLDGAASLKIPEGTQTGKQFRLRGKGLPSGKRGRGDLIVTAVIQPPAKLTGKQREAWQTLAEVSGRTES